jgi:hypothetical protein
MGTSMREFAKLYEQSKKLEKLKVAKNSHNKFRTIKTTVDGITFDSKSESLFYEKLSILERAGKISHIELQPKYILQEGFVDLYGLKHNPIYYIADFEVIFHNGTKKLYDSKGVKTKEYQIKKKLFLYKYPEVLFEEVFFHETHPIVHEALSAEVITKIKKDAILRTKAIAEKVAIKRKQ